VSFGDGMAIGLNASSVYYRHSYVARWKFVPFDGRNNRRQDRRRSQDLRMDCIR
jgi:hypothetical protein